MAKGSKASISKQLFLFLLLITTFNGVAVSQCNHRTFTELVNFTNKPIVDSDYGCATFSKGVDFYHDTFSKNTLFYSDTFSTFASFSHSIFQKNIDFRNSVFSNDFDFSSAVTNEMAIFTSSTFSKKTNFWHSTFLNGVDFTFDTIKSEADFEWATFFKYSSFQNVTFFSTADFSRSTFSNDITFMLAKFPKYADFMHSSFLKGADFHWTEFDSVSDFSHSILKGKMIFEFANFGENSILNLSNITFDSCIISLSHAYIPNYIDLSNNPQINGHIDLTQANLNEIKQKKRCFLVEYFQPYIPYDVDNASEMNYINVNLYNTDVSKIRIDYTHFRLWLIDTYPKNSEAWFGKYGGKLNYDQISSIYEQLLKNFQASGQTESYENLEIEYKYFQSQNAYNPKSDCTVIYFLKHSLWSFWIQDWWWRFGHEKWRIFIHALVFLLLFTTVTFFFLPKLIEVYSVKYIEVYPFNKPFKRLWFSIIYTSTIFFPLALKVDNIKTFKSLWMIYITIMFLTGVICVLYIANYIIANKP